MSENKPKEWWISEEEGRIETDPPGDYPQYSDEVHVTEYSAYERACLEKNALKLELYELKAELAELRSAAEKLADACEGAATDRYGYITNQSCYEALHDYREKFPKGERREQMYCAKCEKLLTDGSEPNWKPLVNLEGYDHYYDEQLCMKCRPKNKMSDSELELFLKKNAQDLGHCIHGVHGTGCYQCYPYSGGK